MDYTTERPSLFNDGGQRRFIRIRDRAKALMEKTGAATMGSLIAGETGSVWELMACVDRMVEIGDIIEIPNTYSTAGQHRIFVLP
jgi:hypothetical protein